MRKFTVLLLYPDYIASNYGPETYLAHVEAKDRVGAIEQGQLQAASDFYTEFDTDDSVAADFFPLAVFEGHLEESYAGR